MSIEDTLSDVTSVESSLVSQNMKKARTCPFSCEDILANILSGPKSLARLMCVSKVWPALIYDRIRPKPPDFRLLCRFRHEVKLLRIDENGDAGIGDDLSFIPNKPWLIVDSCSDMLLCSKMITHSRTVLSIWKPITKQWVDIAGPRDWGFMIPDLSDRKFPKTELFALAAYDECRFKVIRFIYAFGRVSLEMFSSDTGKWSECKAVVSAPSPFILRSLIYPSKSLFLKGALHLVCGNYILVYHIDTDLCSFIELPASSMDVGKLWEARGRLICCLCVKYGFQIWDRKEDDQSSEWELKQDVEFAMLRQQYPEIFVGFNEWSKRWLIVLWPWAFNDDLQCLYLSLPPGRVASYNLETRTLKVIFSFPGQNLYPYEIFPLVRDD